MSVGEPQASSPGRIQPGCLIIVITADIRYDEQQSAVTLQPRCTVLKSTVRCGNAGKLVSWPAKRAVMDVAVVLSDSVVI